MKIDLKFLRDLASEIEAQNLVSGKDYANSASNLDYRVKIKLRRNIIENIVNDFDSLISTQKTLIENLLTADRIFSSLNDIDLSIKTPNFVSIVGQTQSEILESIFGEGVNSVEGLNTIISNLDQIISNATSYSTIYQFENAEFLFYMITEFPNATNFTVQFNWETKTVTISGDVLFLIMEDIKTKHQNLKATVDFVNEQKENTESMEIMALGLSDRYNSLIKTNEYNEVILETLIEDIGIMKDIELLEQGIELLSKHTQYIESLKTQKVLLQSMVYNVRMINMVKPFEDVVNNPDFEENSKELVFSNNYIPLHLKDIEAYQTLPEYVKELYPLKEGIYIDRYFFSLLHFETENGIMINPILGVDYIDLNFLDLKYLNEYQTKIFNYYYRNEGPYKAQEYIEALSDQINMKKGLKKAYDYLDYLATNGLDFGDNINLFFKGGFDGILNTFEGIGNLIYSDSIRSESDYAKMYLIQILNKDTYTSENLENIMKSPNSTEKEIEEFKKLVDLSNRLGYGFWRDLSEHSYQLGSAVGYMTLPVLLNLALPGSGSALLFASSMGNAIEQSHQTLGSLTWESYAYGALTALSEVAMEHLGGLPGFSSASKGFFKSILSEGAQEFFQTFINGALDSAHFSTEFDLTELAPEAFKAAIYGIFTAGIMQGPGVMFTIATKSIDGIKKSNYTFIEALAYLETLKGSTLNLENVNSIDIKEAYNLVKNITESNPELMLKLENTYQNQTLTTEEYNATVDQIKQYFKDNGMESLIEKYENGQKTGKNYEFFLGFEEHTFIHVFRVAIESVAVAPIVTESIQRLSAASEINFNVKGIDEKVLFLSGIAHDLGMTIENAVYYELDLTKRDGSGKYKSILESDIKDKGIATRENHPLNSALEVIRNSDVFGENIELISLLALLHSKSTSGVRTNLSSQAELSKAIDKLYKYKTQNPEFNFDFSKIVEMNDNSTPIIEIGQEEIDYKYEDSNGKTKKDKATVDYNIFKIKPEVIDQLILGTIALRIGDAHALKTGNNQSGNEINIVKNVPYDPVFYELALASLSTEDSKYIKALADLETENSSVVIENFNDDGSARPVENEFSVKIINGERNVSQPITRLSADHLGLEYVYNVHSNNNVYSTWIHGITEKFGEYKSFSFIPQTVTINIPSDASLELQQVYKDMARIYEKETNPAGSNLSGGPKAWFNIKIFIDGIQIYGEGI